MQVLRTLFTTDFGLLSLAAILFMIGMGTNLFFHIKKLMYQNPGKQGWH